MAVAIEAIDTKQLADYSSVPMVCEVRSMLAGDQINDGSDGLARPLREHPVEIPYCKNYDAHADGGPLNWPARVDISNWGLWIAREGNDVIGGAAVAWNTPGFQMVESRNDLAVLWDLRVRPSQQRHGVASALFREAARRAKSKGCRRLKIETQNVNVPACRFYARMGCVLGGIDRMAYRQFPDIADEVMLIWHLELSN